MRPVEFADGEARRAARVLDDTGFRDGRKDVGDAPEDVFAADFVGDEPLVVDAVLQREHGGVLADERIQVLCGRLGVVRFHGEQDVVARPDIRRLVGRGHVDGEIASDALHADAVLTECVEVFPPSDQVDVGTSLCEPAAEVAAHAARTVDGDRHSVPSIRAVVRVAVTLDGLWLNPVNYSHRPPSGVAVPLRCRPRPHASRGRSRRATSGIVPLSDPVHRSHSSIVEDPRVAHVVDHVTSAS